MAWPGIGEVEALHGQSLAGEPLERPPAGRLGHDRILVVGEMPAGVPEGERRVIRHVLDQEHALIPGGDEIGRVPD